LGVNVAFAIRFRVDGLRDIGVALSPMNAFLLLQGLETLSLRSDAICKNSNALAEWLSNCSDVSWVCFPGLPNHKTHEDFKKYFRTDCYGGVISFGVKGG